MFILNHYVFSNTIIQPYQFTNTNPLGTSGIDDSMVQLYGMAFFAIEWPNGQPLEMIQ